jgi:exodeoxyribonuclease VII large subunit
MLLENGFPFVAISGEISNVKQPYSGHTYFTLKDAEAQIRCILFKNQARYLQKPLAEGAKVICKGRITVYRQRGEYQIIVDHVADEGIGRLQLQFEELKAKLLAEGIFAPEAKKTLPPFVWKICLITSPTGAAVHDFLRKALERFADLEVEILPVAVQGERAALEMCRQIEAANRRNWADVIVLTRGGGSLEDLAAFNDEQLARTIHASRLPLVSAIGHEVDFTIADFAADHRSPTPTAAAEELVFDHSLLTAGLASMQQRMARAVTNQVERNKKRLTVIAKHLTDPRRIIEHYQLKVDHVALHILHLFSQKYDRAGRALADRHRQMVDLHPERRIEAEKRRCAELLRRAVHQMTARLQEGRKGLATQAARLEALSPLAVLARGYALVTTVDNKIIRSVGDVTEGDEIRVRLDDGTIKGVVKEKIDGLVTTKVRPSARRLSS